MAHGGTSIAYITTLVEVKTTKNAIQFSYKFMLSEILVLLNSNRNYVNI